ncbi:unnamed protein product [Urochloa decumbens]|uniref:Receptor kinase-like protein Xa21 n=1 Tax=Urochloa decumbens TaxID=240449 RepID=A0ABC8YSL7_9POAL
MALMAQVVICNFKHENDTDRLSLLEFKKAISLDTKQALMSWNDSNRLCSWEGVMCSAEHPHRVSALNLTNPGLVGQISPSLGNLTFLKVIILAANSFTGEIPPTRGQLSHLQNLNLNNNTLQGRIPSLANCSKLRELRLYNNKLAGPIPADLSHGLQRLILGFNCLTGIIPASLANITTLHILSCEDNNIEGSIPSEFAKLSGLQILYMGMNKLSGRFPQAVMNLSNLVGFSVAGSDLNGDLPSNIGNSLPNLKYLYTEDNFFQGPIPSSLANVAELINVDISRNMLTGVVPGSIGDCQSLEDIKLDRNVFRGSIPSSLGSIRTVKFLNLSHNNLTGLIPPSFGSLQLLEQLHMSFNNLEGEVPAEGIFKNATALGLDGNKDLCGGPLKLHLPPCPAMASNSAKHQISVALKVVIPVAILVPLSLAISVLFFLHKRKQKTKSISLPSFGREFPKVSYTDIARATEGFSTSNLIGKGRYGSVYKGSLSRHGNFVAIKIFNPEAKGAQQSFVAECNALRNVRHRNIVPILTACSSIDSNANDFRALVYKFMPQGDLHNLMYFTQDSGNSSYSNYISLGQRLSIVVGISDALAYLHHNNQRTIVHCDPKPSNILLDDDMKAHLGDFGLARIKFHSTSSFVDTNSTSSLAIMGTIGYLAPEYAEGGQVSTATDVYSFGVVLLEIFIRRRPTDEMFKEGMSIAKFTEINFPDKVLQIVDPQLLEDMDLLEKQL